VVPEHLRYGGGVSGTIFSPVVAIVLLLAAVLICILPRNKAIIPFLIPSILIPGDQILVLGGLHFYPLRILILFGLMRIFIIKGRGDWSVFSGGLNKVDKAMILFTLTCAVAGVLLFRDVQAAIFQVGEIYSAFGAYFLLRCLIRNQDDVLLTIRTLGFIVVFLAGVMVCEQLTNGWNPYSLLGGARGAWSMERDGAIRAMGSFGQPLLAGTFGAVAVPLFVGLWMKEKRYRLTAAIGMGGATVMAIASHSSTCLAGVLAGFFALGLWPVRSGLRLIRWGIVVTLVSLHMVMKAPVWHLVARLDLAGGSSSWHRFNLIDTCIHHFWDWWLVGTNANPDWGWDMWDTADQYVANAYRGGLLGLIFFIAILVYGFKYVGRARQDATDKKDQLFFWALGATLFAFTMSFIGISLWDQSIVEWYMLLAMIGAVAVPQVHAAKEQVETAVEQTSAASVEIQPAYTGWSSRQLRDVKPMRRDESAPLHRRHVRGF
jgi:hypothetical protein